MKRESETDKLIRKIAEASLVEGDKNAKNVFVWHKLKKVLPELNEGKRNFRLKEFREALASKGYDLSKNKYDHIFVLKLQNLTYQIICYDWTIKSYDSFAQIIIFNIQRDKKFIADISGKELVDRLYEIDALVGKCLDEEYPPIKKEADKINKRKDITNISVDTLLKNKFDGLDLSYKVEHMSIKTKVWVKVGDRQFYFDLWHRGLVKNVDKLYERILTYCY